MADYAESLWREYIEGDAPTTLAMTKQALAEALSRRYGQPEVHDSGHGRGRQESRAEDYFVPELLLCGRAMKGALEVMRPLLAATGGRARRQAVIGAVNGDLHDIGKDLIFAMLEGAGLKVTDLGIEVSPKKFVEAVGPQGRKILCAYRPCSPSPCRP